ncbi:hypothetical protein EJB05_18709 [Eragrostis curvula]|uniref:Uncharacterized protein n=1 Tax=Eragrostis curvula TaxID=38414 RepID=A0A5J9VKV5_9POAL|nr:hypothetical protein EJB05_18709 [Eragrostis curvula]
MIPRPSSPRWVELEVACFFPMCRLAEEDEDGGGTAGALCRRSCRRKPKFLATFELLQEEKNVVPARAGAACKPRGDHGAEDEMSRIEGHIPPRPGYAYERDCILKVQ